MTKLNIVNPRHIAYAGSIGNFSIRESGHEAGDLWLTPVEWVERVRKILGSIDLDPFSSEGANERVRANRYYSAEDSAFFHEWNAISVYMNPPYSRGICRKAISKFLFEFKAGHFRTGIILCNNMTDTEWFHDLAKNATRRCDLRGRIAFDTHDNKRQAGNTRGQIFFLFCQPNSHNAIGRFDAIMPEKGLVYVPPVKGVAE
jgi:ParB family chromosome partitioning protein